jgi:hypothetical protein
MANGTFKADLWENGIVTGYALDGRGAGVWIPVGHVVQTGYEGHPASYPLSSENAFPRD